MTSIVITGSTRGIGYALAEAFLALGCQVVVSGRTQQAVQASVRDLAETHGQAPILGYPCDVTVADQVQTLWSSACLHFGQVDIWINNAGVGHAQKSFWEHSESELQQILHTNVLGAMYGGQVALRGMRDQGFGQIYNMEGLGSDGRWVEGLTLYGSSKASLRYLTDSLAREVAGTGLVVGALYPGMVVTDFLTGRFEDKPEEWEKAQRVFNVLADLPETVAPWLADRVLKNSRNGIRIRWLSTARVLARFALAPFRKRDLFSATTADEPGGDG